jgi:hypothetical protein
MKRSTPLPVRRSTATMKRRSDSVMERAASLVDHRVALQLDQRLLDVGVDVAEQAGECVIAHHLRTGCAGRTSVVTNVKGDHGVGHRRGHTRQGRRYSTG